MVTCGRCLDEIARRHAKRTPTHLVAARQISETVGMWKMSALFDESTHMWKARPMVFDLAEKAKGNAIATCKAKYPSAGN